MYPQKAVLLTTGFVSPHTVRMNEYMNCFLRNQDNTFIDKIVVFLENGAELYAKYIRYPHKVVLVENGKRPTYRDLIDYANDNLQRSAVIIANSDIFFDESIAELKMHNFKDEFLAISRQEVLSGTVENPYGTQDAWVFLSPIPALQCDFFFGRAGCDNRITKVAADASLNVRNPCLTVRLFHEHKSGFRNYLVEDRVTGEYLHVAPCEL
jgi:hypothetical protein